MKKFTVVCFDEESGQISSHHIEAENYARACWIVANEERCTTFVTIIAGHLKEGENIWFPGEGVVDAETVLDQPEVFNTLSEKEEPAVSTVLADVEIKDWMLTEVGDHCTLPEDMRETYRFVIEQSPSTKQTYFRLYPSSLDESNPDIEINGMSGVIEIRNGKPGISIGLSPDDSMLHIESDCSTGLHVYADSSEIRVSQSMYESFSHGTSFESCYYEYHAR